MTSTGDFQIEIIVGPEAVEQDVMLAEEPTVDLWPPGPIRIEVLTQAEYDQLSPPAPDVLYVVIS